MEPLWIWILTSRINREMKLSLDGVRRTITEITKNYFFTEPWHTEAFLRIYASATCVIIGSNDDVSPFRELDIN